MHRNIIALLKRGVNNNDPKSRVVKLVGGPRVGPFNRKIFKKFVKKLWLVLKLNVFFIISKKLKIKNKKNPAIG